MPTADRADGAAPITAVLFDLDGTLIDSAPLIRFAFREATLRVLGREPTPDEMIRGWGQPVLVRMRQLDATRAEELGREYVALCVRHHDEQVRPYPGAREVLEELGRRGVRRALVTSKKRLTGGLSLRAFDLERHLDAAVFEEDVRNPKPDPEALLLAAERLGVPAAAALMVGDSASDVVAARAAGMRSAAAMWGAEEPDALLTARPDHVLGNLRALLALAGYGPDTT